MPLVSSMNCNHATVTLPGSTDDCEYCPTCDTAECLQCGQKLIKGAFSPNRWHLMVGTTCQNYLTEHAIQTRTRITLEMPAIEWGAPAPTRCECGARITHGVADWTPWHSDGCPVRRV